jgi:tRNA-specific 2-thiouridylase
MKNPSEKVNPINSTIESNTQPTASNQEGVTKTKPKVLVAMSGGVDSSVAAALLVEQGYDVIGCTMQVWDYTQNDSCSTEQEGNGTCCSSTDVDDARAVADKLNIPFYVLNCETEFQSKVIDPFVESYLQGETPIPCVNCNTYLKFDHLIKKMQVLGCDYLATGHYAQMVEIDGQKTIKTSSDDWKDQTYFLFTLDPKILDVLIFPVGDMEKPKVREYAELNDLIVAKKKDSTGICFIGNGKYSEFIESRVSSDLLVKGQMLKYPGGEVLGDHSGLHHFTYGQRKRLGISYAVPLYVKKIDYEAGNVWLAEEKDLYASEMKIKNFNSLRDFQEDETLKVKIRFQHRGAQAKVHKNEDGTLSVKFLEPQRSITPGQAAVFYRDRELLGGGWII